MSNNPSDPPRSGDVSAPPQSSGDLPDWILKPFDGMAPGRPLNLKPYVPPRQGLLTFERLRLAGLSVLLGGLLLAFAILGSQPFGVLNPDPPGLRHDIVTPIPPSSLLPSSASTTLLQKLSLDEAALKSWTNQDWDMLYFSRAPDVLTRNSYLYNSLQAFKPQSFASQDFVNSSSSCAPFCQVSWAGLTFNDVASALKAFVLMDKDNKSSPAGYSSLGFSNNGSGPAWSCISTAYPGYQTGWVTCLFVWGNLLTSTRIISADTGLNNFTDSSMSLIDQINMSWQTRLPGPAFIFTIPGDAQAPTPAQGGSNTFGPYP
jgi:hypothetical protein